MQITLLFDSVHSAEEVAYILRGLWDGCNAVTFTDFDEDDTAFQTVVEMVLAKYCIVGQKWLIKDVESHNNSPTSSISCGEIPSRVGCKVTPVSQDPDLVDKELLKAVKERMLLAYLIHPNLFNSQKLLKPASVRENNMPSEI